VAVTVFGGYRKQCGGENSKIDSSEFSCEVQTSPVSVQTNPISAHFDFEN
jgi:hypothetical protein